MRKAMLALFLVLAVTAAGTAAAQTTISIWFVGQSPVNVDYYQNVVFPSFEEAFPQYKVEPQFLGWDVYADRLSVGFASGVAPDIFQAGAHMVAMLAARGMARPMDEYLNAWPEYQDFFPGARASSIWNGRAYGIPLPSAGRGFYYRKDLLAEMGADPERPPATWDELMDALKRYTVHDGQGNVTRFGAAFESSIWHPWVAFLYQNDTELATEDGNTPLFNTPGGVETMEFFVEFLRTYRSFGTLTSSSARLDSGEYIMYFGGQSHFVPYARQNDPSVLDQIGVVPPLTKKSKVSILYTDWLAFGSQSTKLDAAFELGKWIARVDHHLGLAQNLNQLPSRATAIDSDYVRENRLIREEMDKVMPFTRPWAFWEGVNQRPVAELMDRAANGELSPAAAVQTLATMWVPLIQD